MNEKKSLQKYAVETISLTKEYNKTPAVNHLDMKVREGAIYGFIEIGRASCRERV